MGYLARTISDNAAQGAATETHFTRRHGMLIGSSTGPVSKRESDRERELEAALGLTAALSLKYGTTISGEIDWPR